MVDVKTLLINLAGGAALGFIAIMTDVNFGWLLATYVIGALVGTLNAMYRL